MRGALDLIPHRAPWSLVDRVLASDGESVEAEKLLSLDDPLAEGELPDLLVVEALAQAAACANAGGLGKHRGLLVAAQAFEFAGRARAGDRLRLWARRIGVLGALHKFEAEASVDGKLIARGQMTFALEPAA